jgi:hypothetical protein
VKAVQPITKHCKASLITETGATRAFFSGKRGARTHKRGKDKYTESFVTISLSCSPTS